jgi:peptidylprolyl isomerase
MPLRRSNLLRSPAAAAPLALVALLACAPRTRELPAPIPPIGGEERTAFALRYIDISPGSGAPAAARKCLFAHYTGWLTNGTKFDSSRDTTPNGQPRTPISFPQGARRVISGWDVGFEGMRVGGRRRLLIPYQLAYGELGRPPVIPPRAQLIFDVELMAVTDTLRTDAPSAPPAGGPPQPGPRCPAWADASRGAP